MLLVVVAAICGSSTAIVVARIVVIVGRCGNKNIAVAAVVCLVSITAVACCYCGSVGLNS